MSYASAQASARVHANASRLCAACPASKQRSCRLCAAYRLSSAHPVAAAGARQQLRRRAMFVSSPAQGPRLREWTECRARQLRKLNTTVQRVARARGRRARKGAQSMLPAQLRIIGVAACRRRTPRCSHGVHHARGCVVLASRQHCRLAGDKGRACERRTLLFIELACRRSRPLCCMTGRQARQAGGLHGAVRAPSTPLGAAGMGGQ